MSLRAFIHRSLLATLLLFSANVFASTESPETAVREYLADLKIRGFSAVPTHMHQEELQRFKSMMIAMFQPGGPPNYKELIADLFGPEATHEYVAALPPAEFMKVIFSSAGRQMRALNVRFGDSEVLGSVQEGSVTHVVTRMWVGTSELTMNHIEVISVRKEGVRWRLLLTGRIEGMAEAFRAQAQRRR